MREPYYDIKEDWALIVASFQTQYGIRISKELAGMSWYEFSYLLSGLSGDTPLGHMIGIRAEDDPKVIKTFTPEQRTLRAQYRKKLAMRKSKQDVDNTLDKIQQAFVSMAK